jgi:hypothetical protein
LFLKANKSYTKLKKNITLAPIFTTKTTIAKESQRKNAGQIFGCRPRRVKRTEGNKLFKMSKTGETASRIGRNGRI